MEKQIIADDEVILLEYDVTRDDIKGDVHLTLTSKKILFEQKIMKGIIKKQKVKKLVDAIELNHIKLYEGNVQACQKNECVSIQTLEENIVIKFSSKNDAAKFTNKVIDTVTGTTKVKRIMNKVKEVRESVDETLGDGATSMFLKTGAKVAVAFTPVPKGKKAAKVVKTAKKAVTAILNSK